MAPELIAALTLVGVGLVLVTYWIAQPRLRWPWQRKTIFVQFHDWSIQTRDFLAQYGTPEELSAFMSRYLRFMADHVGNPPTPLEIDDFVHETLLGLEPVRQRFRNEEAGQ